MKRIVSTVPAALVALALTAMLSSTGCMVAYQPMGTNGGHTFNRTGPDTFEVTFQSNTNMFDDRLRDYCLLRAAEVTKEYGYDYFTVEGELYGELTRMIPTTHTTTITTPAPTGSTGSGSGSSGSSGSGTSSKSKPPTTTTVSTTGTTQVGLPNFTLRIRCFTAYPSVAHIGTVLEAESVREELAAKYEIALY